MDELMREALIKISHHDFVSPISPIARMARAALHGDAQAMQDARRQLELAEQGRVAYKALPDELPRIWNERIAKTEGHGVRNDIANAIRECVSELEAALSFAQYKVPDAFQVGRYHKASLSPYPYHYRHIKWRDTAEACEKQWRTEGIPDGTEIRIVPLYKAVVSARMEALYQVVSAQHGADYHWIDCSKARYDEETDPDCRRIVWYEAR